MSEELKRYLTERGIASSKTMLYHPTGNAQCERINQTVWRNVKLILRTCKESENCWEAVLPEALHAVRSLLRTATNTTPHERFLGFNQRSTSGRALPSFLIQPGPVLLRRFIRSKSDPLVEQVELLDANPSFLMSVLQTAENRPFQPGPCPETCRQFRSYKYQTNHYY